MERRLEVMLSRRAVAMAHAQQSGRVDCVGASKGLFTGLLLLVGAMICLILFFVLIRHQEYTMLAIYLADSSHCVLMFFALIAILIGFCRVQSLKFRCEEGSNLNDILLRISAFGLFIYAIFSVISGALNALESEPNLLVAVTGLLAVVQVVFQLLFIGDVSRRRVHLPEHDRTKPGRQIVTFLLICNIAMFVIYTFEAQKVFANPVSDGGELIEWGIYCFCFSLPGAIGLLRFHRVVPGAARDPAALHFPPIPQRRDPGRDLEDVVQGAFRLNWGEQGESWLQRVERRGDHRPTTHKSTFH